MNTNERNQESTVIDIKDLSDIFKRNETEARKQYTGKTVVVKGVARRVGPDSYGLPSIDLTDREGGAYYAVCLLPLSDYLKLRNVKKGQELVITGECRYLTDIKDDKDVLVFKHCKVFLE